VPSPLIAPAPAADFSSIVLPLPVALTLPVNSAPASTINRSPALPNRTE